jgi:cytidylate kinase
VIVGRGAAQILPVATTLRVRLVASVEDRVAVMSGELGVSSAEAARHVERTDRERARFIRDHFGKDPTDPQNYDLVLNSSYLSVAACADVVVTALHCRQAGRRTRATAGVGAPGG